MRCYQWYHKALKMIVQEASGRISVGLRIRLVVVLDVVLVLEAAFAFVARGSSPHTAFWRVAERVVTGIVECG